MGSFVETGVVYFLWPVMILTLIFEYVWDILCILIAFSFHMPKGTAKGVLKSKLLSVWVTSVGGNAVLALVIYGLCLIAEGTPALAQWLDHPFEDLGGTLAALGCIVLILAAGLLKYTLYRRIVFKKAGGIEAGDRLRACRILGIMTTPWLYLLPTTQAYGILGTVMMGIGSLAPGELPME